LCPLGLNDYPMRHRDYHGRADEYKPGATDGDLDGGKGPRIPTPAKLPAENPPAPPK
jgi:hypothetical protein